jgi:hypothetical protein
MQKILKALDGHKSAIGATINLILMWLVGKEIIPEDVSTLILSVASVWTGIAVGHNVVKIKKVK